MTLFVKQYADERHAARARTNYAWLASLSSGVLLPDLVAGGGCTLAFRRIAGTTPGQRDLVVLAATIGQMHRAATPLLTGARLDRRHRVGEHVIDDFTESRRAALQHAAAVHSVGPQWIDAILDRAAEMRPAFYKDSNLRNFLLTANGVGVVDFDDLTLAPHGYDLAKLVTSMAMTFGQLNLLDILSALDTYNSAVGYAACAARHLAIWAELNWLLTANYIGRNGYQHPWPRVRPWSNPFQEGSRWPSARTLPWSGTAKPNATSPGASAATKVAPA